MKTKPRSYVQVVKDDNNKVIGGECAFQLDELVDPYRVFLFTELGNNLNFHVNKNIYIYVDVDKLNDILSTSEHIKINEDEIIK